MSDDSSGEKTEEPTDKKIDDARKRGQVWKSRDLGSLVVFLVGLAAVKVSGDLMETQFRRLFTFAFDHIAHPQEMEAATFHLLILAVTSVLIITLPIAGSAAIMAATVDFLQVGALFAAEVLIPKLDKLNPIQGFKNMFSKKQIVEALKSMFKIAVTGYVVYGVIKGAIGLVAATPRLEVGGVMFVLAELVSRVAIRVGLLFTLFAIFDVWWQRMNYYKDLMMTKDEVKREYKESEGDPHHKHKRKEMHMEILESAQVQSVKGADAVVTNPTHMAVALAYDRDRDAAPKVIAKGIDSRAELIKEIAKQADVAILRNVPLAHALYRLDVGHEIPEELYDAVAEVLNFVYSLKAPGPARGKAAPLVGSSPG